MTKAKDRIIHFDNNYNSKLSCKVGDIFTSIRKGGFDNTFRYRNAIGDNFSVMHQEIYMMQAKLVNAENVKYMNLQEYLVLLDTGLTDELDRYNLFVRKEVIQDVQDNVLILTFKRLE